MQLASTAVAVVATLTLATAAAAQDREAGDGEVSSKMSVYADDDATTVLTSAADAEVAVPANIAVGAHVLVDAVSTASVDVVSAATSRWTEDRVEVGGRARARLGTVTEVGLGVTRSQENDWQSTTVSLQASRDFADRNTRVSAGYALVDNRVGRADDPTFERDLLVHSLQLGVAQLWSKTTLFGLTYSAQHASGYQSSPYRFASIEGDGGLVRMPEAHPEQRLRQAVTARALRSLGTSMSLEGTYRFYFDDWGIQSHTATSALTLEAARWVDLRARVRGYHQSAAAFYADTYEMPRVYVTADRELGRFWDVGGGLKAMFYATVGGARLIIDVKVDALHYRFDDFARLPRRNALVTGAGARVAW